MRKRIGLAPPGSGNQLLKGGAGILSRPRRPFPRNQQDDLRYPGPHFETITASLPQPPRSGSLPRVEVAQEDPDPIRIDRTGFSGRPEYRQRKGRATAEIEHGRGPPGRDEGTRRGAVADHPRRPDHAAIARRETSGIAV